MSTPLESLGLSFFTSALRAFGVDVSLWGNGDARSVEDFLRELNGQESYLRLYPEGLTRVVRVVKFIIEDGGRRFLIEDRQVLPDGRIRKREQAPGGKIAAGETLDSAVRREMREELGLETARDYEWQHVKTEMEETPSRSYPGIRCVYELNHCRIHLHTGVEIPDGYERIDEEDGKTLVFRWVSELPERKKAL